MRRQNGELEIWLPPVKGKEYLVAVDPAGGGSEGDYSAAQVLEMETGLQCAEFAGHVGGLELAQFVTGAGDGVQRSVAGGGAEQPRQRRAGAGGDGVQVWANLPAGRAGGLADDEREPAGDAGAAGCGAGGGAGAVPEPDGCWGSAGALCGCRMGASGAQAGTHDDRVMAMAMGLAARAELVGKSRNQQVSELAS